MRTITETYINLGLLGEVEVRIEATWMPAEHGSTDGPGGPKLEEDIPAHWHIDKVTCEAVPMIDRVWDQKGYSGLAEALQEACE